MFFLENVDLPGDLYVFLFENHKIAILGVMTQPRNIVKQITSDVCVLS